MRMTGVLQGRVIETSHTCRKLSSQGRTWSGTGCLDATCWWYAKLHSKNIRSWGSDHNQNKQAQTWGVPCHHQAKSWAKPDELIAHWFSTQVLKMELVELMEACLQSATPNLSHICELLRLLYLHLVRMNGTMGDTCISDLGTEINMQEMRAQDTRLWVRCRRFQR